MVSNVSVMKDFKLLVCNVSVTELKLETDVIGVLTDQTQNGSSEAVGVNLASLCMELSACQVKLEATHHLLVTLLLSTTPNKEDVYLAHLVVSVALAVTFVLNVDLNLTMIATLSSVLNIVETERDLFLNVMMETISMVMDVVLIV